MEIQIAICLIFRNISCVKPQTSNLLIPLAVRSSTIHSRGLFTLARIPRRMKLGELTGELRRLPQIRIEMQKLAAIYLVELNRRWALDCREGNAFKHLNHSCGANCYLRVINKRVEIYSRRAIPAQSELTVDYRETQHPGGMACRCGAPECRSRL